MPYQWKEKGYPIEGFASYLGKKETFLLPTEGKTHLVQLCLQSYSSKELLKIPKDIFKKPKETLINPKKL